LDGTLGAGGYAERILRASEPDGKVVGLDLDAEAVVRTKERLKEFETRFNAVHAGFHEAKTILKELGISAVDGAVLDLGISSEQLEDPKRGFSFRVGGALDMRFDNTAGQPLTEYLWSISRQELEEILSTYGEERYFRRLAKAILESRDRGKLKTAEDLAEVVSRCIGSRKGKIHPSSDVDIALLVERAAADDFPLPSFVASLEPACGCPLDVVLLNRAGEVLKHQVRRHGKLLFERDPDKRKHFEIISRKLYEDFLYLHRKYVQTVLYGRQGFKSPGQELNG